MAPSLLSDDYIIVLRFPWSRFYQGQVVLVEHTQYQLIVKRIADVRGQEVLLMGDHPCSLSSDDMGWVDEKQIVGKLFCRIEAKH